MLDPRAPDQVTHSFADIVRFRLLMIAADYEDGIDANALRSDPVFKMALDLAPSDRQLCSQSTISRLENLPDVCALLQMGRAMVDLYAYFGTYEIDEVAHVVTHYVVNSLLPYEKASALKRDALSIGTH